MWRKCIFAALIACTPALGYAFDCTNWYLRGFAGLNCLSVPSIPELKTDTDIGYALGGSIGYQFSSTFRAEGELTYRHNSLDQFVVKADNTRYRIDLDGDVSSLAFMGNIFFDLPLKLIFRPYLGAGLGGYREWGKGHIPILQGTPDELKFKIRQSGAAYQLIVGLNVLECFIKGGIEYHYFDSITESNSSHSHTIAFTLRQTF